LAAGEKGGGTVVRGVIGGMDLIRLDYRLEKESRMARGRV